MLNRHKQQPSSENLLVKNYEKVFNLRVKVKKGESKSSGQNIVENKFWVNHDLRNLTLNSWDKIRINILKLQFIRRLIMKL